MLKAARALVLFAFALPVMFALQNPLSLDRIDSTAAALVGAAWMMGCMRLLRHLTIIHG